MDLRHLEQSDNVMVTLSIEYNSISVALWQITEYGLVRVRENLSWRYLTTVGLWMPLPAISGDEGMPLLMMAEFVRIAKTNNLVTPGPLRNQIGE